MIVINKVSLVAFDIGGTLISDDNVISNENLDTILRLKKKGVIIALTTAREYSSTKYISKQINCDYGVFSNGTHLMDINKVKSLKISILKTKAVLELHDYCKKIIYIYI